MSLKTKKMLKIFQPIEELVHKLSQLLKDDASENSQAMVSVKKLILDQLYALAAKFENVSNGNADSYKDMKKKIALIIEEFCTIDFNRKVNITDIHDNEVFSTLINKFMQVLENLEKYEILTVKQCLEECLTYVKEMGSSCEIEDMLNIKELGTSIVDILGPLQNYKKNLVSKLLSEKLGLYCCQLCISFTMLVQLTREQYQLNAPIYTCKKYICERLSLCIESIISVLDAPKPNVEEECLEQENNFVYRIDLVLDIINSISNKLESKEIVDCEDLWLGIEDVFTHAMSIAQVCHPYNFKTISGSCQSILTEYENLKTQIRSDPPDPTMNNLFINTLTYAVYRLERKINISVLTLVMDVFSDPFGALKRLTKMCGSTLSAKDRSTNDLTSAVEEFDQLTDKSMQIGKFAIACCRDRNRAAKIKNSLASFESLEMELVPAISAFYLHPDNKEMRACVKLLTAQWQLEMNKFRHTVDLIIDPAAYCQIVLDDLQDRVTEMSNCLDNKVCITQSHVQIAVQRAISLSRQINATVEDIGNENINKQTIMIIRDFKAAIYECDAVAKKYLHKTSTSADQLRVINRCELMLKVVKRLIPVLTSIVNNSIDKNTSNSASYNKSAKGLGNPISSITESSFPSSIHGLPFDQKSSVYIRTPYSVKSCKQPLSIQPANTVPRNESDVSILIPYIQKGRLIRTEWSVMYKTPNTCKSEKQVHNQLRMRNLSSVRQHLFSRDSFLEDSETDISVESLDLTNILEQITGLSDTLSSVTSNTTSTEEKLKTPQFLLKKSKHVNKAHLNRIAKKLAECSAIGGGDAPALTPNSEKSKIKENKVNVLVKI